MSAKQLSFRYLLVLITLSAVATAAPQDTVTPFRSELWQLEYSAKEKRSELPFAESSSGTSRSTATSGAVDSGELNIDYQNIPGQVTLEDLSSETPIAEMYTTEAQHFDAKLASFDNSPSAWKMSRLDSGAPDPYARSVAHGDGPSTTTFLVGVLAVIVVVGALLTGRE